MSKKLYIVLLTLFLMLALLGAFLIIKEVMTEGGDDPVDAVWSYERASMEADAGEMLRYSSGYNIAMLEYRNPSDEPLEDYLERLYDSTRSIYEDANLSYSLIDTYEIGSAEPLFVSLLEKYRTEDEKTAIESFAYVKISVIVNGTRKFDFPAYVAKTDGRWYYFMPAD